MSSISGSICNLAESYMRLAETGYYCVYNGVETTYQVALHAIDTCSKCWAQGSWETVKDCCKSATGYNEYKLAWQALHLRPTYVLPGFPNTYVVDRRTFSYRLGRATQSVIHGVTKAIASGTILTGGAMYVAGAVSNCAGLGGQSPGEIHSIVKAWSRAINGTAKHAFSLGGRVISTAADCIVSASGGFLSHPVFFMKTFAVLSSLYLVAYNISNAGLAKRSAEKVYYCGVAATALIGTLFIPFLIISL